MGLRLHAWRRGCSNSISGTRIIRARNYWNSATWSASPTRIRRIRSPFQAKQTRSASRWTCCANPDCSVACVAPYARNKPCLSNCLRKHPRQRHQFAPRHKLSTTTTPPSSPVCGLVQTVYANGGLSIDSLGTGTPAAYVLTTPCCMHLLLPTLTSPSVGRRLCPASIDTHDAVSVGRRL